MGNGIVLENRTGKMWQHDYSKTFKGHTLAGYNDWRLPTREELYELAMMFDLKEAGDIRMQIEGNYWLTEKDGNSIVGSWEIGDQCEPERFFFSKKRGRVRLVRQ